MFSSRKKASAKNRFDAICHFINSGADDIAIADTIKKFIKKFGKTLFLKYYDDKSTSFTIAKNGNQLYIGKLIHLLIHKNHHSALAILLENGVHPEECMIWVDGTDYKISFTPLELAVITSNATAVKMLLNMNVEMDHLDQEMNNIVHLATSTEICNLLLEKAVVTGNAKKMLLQTNNRQLTPFEEAIGHDLPEVLSALHAYQERLNLIDPKRYQVVVSNIVIGILRNELNLYLWLPTLRTIRTSLNNHFQLDVKLDFPLSQCRAPQDISEKEINKICNDLFTPHFISRPTDCDDEELKAEALKKANAYCYAILNNPPRCLPILQYLNNQFERYYAETHPDQPFQFVDDDEYEFKIADRTEFAIPKQHSRYFGDNTPPCSQKHSALKEFLLLLLRRHGMGDDAVKWVGFVPAEFADATIQSGNLVLESGISGATILHGVYSHMLQLAIILIAIEKKMIPLSYKIYGPHVEITAAEIVASQTTLKNKSNRPIWMAMRDTRYINEITFVDPHRLNSYIMYYGKRFGMRTLSSYLIDSTCKNMAKMYRNIASEHQTIHDFGLFTFIEILFSAATKYVQTAPNLTNAAIQKYEKDPKRFSIFNKSDGTSKNEYAVVTVNHYQPNPRFKFRL